MKTLVAATAVVLFFVTGKPIFSVEPMRMPRSWTNPRTAPLIWLNLKVGRRYTFETRHLSRGADTILTVIDETSGPVAENDDRVMAPKETTTEPRSSRVSVVPRKIVPHGVMVKARPGSPDGTCDLYMDGRLLAKELSFGKRFLKPKPVRLPPPAPATHSEPMPEIPLYELPRSNR